MNLKTISVACSIIAGSLILTNTSIAGKNDDTLRVAMTGEILNLDYLHTTRREYIILAEMTDDTLFHLNPETNEFGAGVATHYEWVNDTTIDVFLRDDVLFHDRTALTADDVVYTYNWIINDVSESQAKGVVSRWLDYAEKLDDHSVRFHIQTVYPLLLRDMARRIKLRKDGSYHVNGEIDHNAMAINFVGLGPYEVVSFEPGRELVLKRFEDYFGQKPAIENVVVRNIPDRGTQQAELLSGGIDWMFQVPLELAENLGQRPDATHLSGPDLRIGFLVLDAAGYSDPNGPLTDVRVRQAINHALNRQEMSEFLVGGSSEPIHTACHPAQFGCTTDVQEYVFDRDRARELLAEAGYPNGFPLELWAYRERPVSEAIASDLSAIGIDVSLRYVQLSALNQARAQQNITAYFGSWGSGGTADTAAIARVHFSDTSDRNLSGDDGLTEMIMAAEQTIDSDERLRLYDKALNLIADQAYWAPLYSNSANYLVTPELNFPLSRDGLPRLQHSSWK